MPQRRDIHIPTVGTYFLTMLQQHPIYDLFSSSTWINQYTGETQIRITGAGNISFMEAEVSS